MTTVAFTRMKDEDLDLVREWRTRPDIERWMTTPGPADAEEHRRWFERTRDDPRFDQWIIRAAGTPVGVINLADIDVHHRRASIGYYLGRRDRLPIGGLVMAYMLNHAFDRDDLNLRKVTGEVFADNDRVLRLHELLGYRVVGTLQDHVLKDDGWHDVVVLEIFRERWRANRGFARYVAEFE